MPLVRFTENIQRHVKCPEKTVPGTVVREALDAYFAENRQARLYVVDEHGALRKHMAVFIDGKPITDRTTLNDAVSDHATIDVMQALSGG